MRRLLLLRHTKSDWPAGIADRERPLNARGRDAAPLVGAYLARHGLTPDRVVVSPARRARETLDLAADAFATDPTTEIDERIYEAAASELLAVVREQPDGAHSVLLVGHNPGFQDLALALVASGEADARRRLAEKFPTGGLAVIDFAVDAWHEVHPRAGRLDRFVAPRTLGGGAD
jgi:phosphohistidine phosphatase